MQQSNISKTPYEVKNHEIKNNNYVELWVFNTEQNKLKIS